MYKIFERAFHFTKEKELIAIKFNPTTTRLTWSVDLVEVRPLGPPVASLMYLDFVYISSVPPISEVPLFERPLKFRNE